MGIIYHQISNNPLPYDLTSYADNNFAGNPTDRKLVIEYCFFLNEAVVSCSNKKQTKASNSTTEAEYIVLGNTKIEAVWNGRFIIEMDLDVVENATLYGNNKMSINLTKNAESQHRIKHINVQH